MAGLNLFIVNFVSRAGLDPRRGVDSRLLHRLRGRFRQAVEFGHDRRGRDVHAAPAPKDARLG